MNVVQARTDLYEIYLDLAEEFVRVRPPDVTVSRDRHRIRFALAADDGTNCICLEAPVVGLPTDIPGLPPPIIGPQ